VPPWRKKKRKVTRRREREKMVSFPGRGERSITIQQIPKKKGSTTHKESFTIPKGKKRPVFVWQEEGEYTGREKRRA